MNIELSDPNFQDKKRIRESGPRTNGQYCRSRTDIQYRGDRRHRRYYHDTHLKGLPARGGHRTGR